MVLKILMDVIQHDMTLNCVCPAGYNHYQLHLCGECNVIHLEPL